MNRINLFTEDVIDRDKQNRYLKFRQDYHSNECNNKNSKPRPKEREKSHRTEKGSQHQI